MVVLGIIASLIIAVQDPVFQKFAARYAAGYLSKKTGGDIKVGRLLVAPDLSIYLDDVVVKDLRQNELANVQTMRSKLAFRDVLKGVIHLENVKLKDVKANLIQYEGEDKFNYAFLVDAFKSEDTTAQEPFHLIIDKIELQNLDVVYWNQNEDDPLKTEQGVLDYSHIALSDVNLSAEDFFLYDDSIRARVNALNAKEISGLELKSFETDAVVFQKGIFLDGLKAELNSSRIDADIHMNYADFDAFSNFVDSVVFDATIRPTEIMMSDLGVFSETMYQMPNRIRFEGRFTGPIEHICIDDLTAEYGESTVVKGSMKLHPLDFENGNHELNISKLQFSYSDLEKIRIPSSTQKLPLPESLRPMKTARASLSFKGSINNFDSKIHLVSGLGNVDLDLSRQLMENGDDVFSGRIDAEEINAGLIADAQEYVGNLDLNTDFVVRIPEQGNVDLTMKGKAYNADLMGYRINEIVLNGDLKENRFNGSVTVEDDVLDLDFNGLVDFNDKKYPVADFKAVVNHADLKALKLVDNDSISEIKTRIIANFKGFNLDDLQGELHLDSTVYRDSRGSYNMDRFEASVIKDNLMQRRYSINCDFFNFEIAGKMNFASLIPAFNEYVDQFVHFPQFETDMEDYRKYALTHDVDQDFIVSLVLKDTRTLSRLFMPSLKIAKNSTVNGTFTSRSGQFNLTARTKSVEFGDVTIENLELRNFNNQEASFGSLTIGRVGYTNISAADTMSIGLDNLLFFVKMANDTIASRIKWDDVAEADHNKALIETYFHPHQGGGVFGINKADIVINDSLWNVQHDNHIDINDGKVKISNLVFNHNQQSIGLDGYVPMNENDTVLLQLRNFDISNLDILTQALGFDADGYITGDAQVSGLNDIPTVLANLRIDQIALDGDHIGDAEVVSSWNNEDKSVDMEVNLLNDEKQMLNVTGSYYTDRDDDNLDFTVALDSLRLVAASPLLSGLASRIQGYGDGLIEIKGSIDEPDIMGKVSIIDGGCKVDYLQTFYTFHPTILIDNKTITFEDMVLVDTLGNTAMVEGEIRHDRFKDLYLDLKLHPKNFLGLATSSKDNDLFFGSAVANGLVTVTGPFSDISLDIKARALDGTDITIPFNTASTVGENDFIVFLAPQTDTIQETSDVEELKRDFDYTVGLDVDATDFAKLRVTLPSDLGTIEMAGNGNVKMKKSSSAALTMHGAYTITSGRFQLTLMNLVNRTFSLKKGGTVIWSGRPTEGRINATGAYNIKASLSDLGIMIDSTSSVSNTVSVECLIHLNDALLNPTISFGMRLPNASEDVIQTVYSVVDTTNQMVMANQALSLLVFGKFAYAGGSAGADQTMNISNLFSTNFQFDITKNMNLGVSYHSGSDDSYDEYQVALRTELFENRLTIETNLGVMSSNNPSADVASNIVGEFDLYYKLSKDGRLQAHFYNHSNYNTNFNSFAIDRRAPYTQGLGLSYSRSFPTFRELFRKKNKPADRPLFIKPKNMENN